MKCEGKVDHCEVTEQVSRENTEFLSRVKCGENNFFISIMERKSNRWLKIKGRVSCNNAPVLALSFSFPKACVLKEVGMWKHWLPCVTGSELLSDMGLGEYIGWFHLNLPFIPSRCLSELYWFLPPLFSCLGIREIIRLKDVLFSLLSLNRIYNYYKEAVVNKILYMRCL